MREEILVYEKMTLEHLDRVMEIENASFSQPFTYEMMQGELINRNAHYIVVLAGGTVAAYGGYWKILDEAHIITIAVSPHFRRRGIGKELMLRLIGQASAQGVSSMTLEVRVSNEAAIAMYTQLGFTVNGIRKGYYEDNREDALIMWNHNINTAII